MRIAAIDKMLCANSSGRSSAQEDEGLTLVQTPLPQQESPLSEIPRLRRVLVATSILATLVLLAGVVTFGRFGGGFVQHMAAIEPDTVLQEGQSFEEAGLADRAIACYRKSIELGLRWPPSRLDTMARLTRLLRQCGGIRDYPNDSLRTVLPNGGFESGNHGVDSWTTSGAQIETDTIEKVEGDQSAKLVLDAATGDVLSQNIALVPNVRYRASFWARTQHMQGATLALTIGASAAPTPAWVTCGSVPAESDWKQYAAAFTVPADAREGRVALNVTGKATGVAWVDGIVINRAEDSPLRNGSFELGDGLAYWAKPPDAVAVAADASIRVEGRQSLKVTLPAATNFGLEQTVDVIPGRAYRLTGWVRTNDVAGVGACLEVADATHGWQAFCRSSEFVVGTSDWRLLAVDFNVPNNTTRINVLLRRPNSPDQQNAPAQGTVWFDGYQLEARATP